MNAYLEITNTYKNGDIYTDRYYICKDYDAEWRECIRRRSSFTHNGKRKRITDVLFFNTDLWAELETAEQVHERLMSVLYDMDKFARTDNAPTEFGFKREITFCK